ncbi:thiolase [Nocardia sp. 852002-20019_SCH5090214]|nr:thiolase [Nocardia sp. 852002-20019_SCH5090214]
MSDVFVVGTSMTRFGPFPDESVKSLTATAVTDVVADAGISLDRLQVAFFSNASQDVIEGQTSTPGQFALHSAGLAGLPVVNVENGCASGSSALWLAAAQVRSGAADYALAIGAEKMAFRDPDRRALVMEAFAGGLDRERATETVASLRSLGADIAGDFGDGHRTMMMDVYAGLCRAHMARFGTTREQLAAIASKNHTYASMNDKCHYNKPMTAEEILAGRPLAYPLTVPMCSPLSDGAAAAIVTNRQGLRRLSLETQRRAVRVRACELRSATDRAWDEFDRHVIRRAAYAAYEAAGVGPGDVDVAEVHDAAAFGELFASELLGFCPIGEGGRLAESGATSIGGSIPINPSGGLVSRGHPIGATGLAQIHELTTQLRGEAGARQVDRARVAIQENGGAFLGVEEAAAVVTILTAE